MEKAPGICSDAITRVPMIWWGPEKFKAGHVAAEIVELIDISTTLCTLSGLPQLETSDGKDISHLLAGEHGDVHRVGVTELAWSKSVRKGNYRMVYYPPEMFPEEHPDGFGELYDLAADPHEMTKRYFDADYADIVAEFHRELLNWLIASTRPGTVLGVNSRRRIESEQVIQRSHTDVLPDGKIRPEWMRAATTKNYL